MDIKSVVQSDVAILTLSGNFLCEPDKFMLKEQVSGLMTGNIRNIIVDLSEVHCVNSEGLGTLVMSLTSLRKAGGDLRLAQVNDMIHKTFVITQLVKIFEIYDTVEEAIASYHDATKHIAPPALL